MTRQADARQTLFHHFALGLLGPERASRLVASASKVHDPEEYARRFGVLLANHLLDLEALQAGHISREAHRQAQIIREHHHYVNVRGETMGPIMQANMGGPK